MSRIADNYRRLLERIDRAADRGGRDVTQVKVCAVTKRVALPEIRAAVDAGARILGESRVQEAAEKIPAAEGFPEVSWHLIGKLQRNKARRAVELFGMIQSVDSPELARRLSTLGQEHGRKVPILLEVLTSDEGTKSGLPLERLEPVLEEIEQLEGIRLRGLMTMAPWTKEESRVRASFAALRGLRERFGQADWELSMGMTGDFEIAVEEGSTMVRVGTGIFG